MAFLDSLDDLPTYQDLVDDVSADHINEAYRALEELREAVGTNEDADEESLRGRLSTLTRQLLGEPKFTIEADAMTVQMRYLDGTEANVPCVVAMLLSTDEEWAIPLSDPALLSSDVNTEGRAVDFTFSNAIFVPYRTSATGSLTVTVAAGSPTTLYLWVAVGGIWYRSQAWEVTP